MDFVDFELEIKESAGSLTIELVKGELWRATDPQPFVTPEVTATLQGLSRKTQRSAESRSSVTRNFATDPDDDDDDDDAKGAMTTIGNCLATSVFQGDIRSRYDFAMGTGRPLRIRIHVPDSLAGLPWEAIRTPDAKKFITRTKDQHVVRVSNAPRAPSVRRTGTLRVLALAATPKGLADLDVEAEEAWLKQALAPLEARRAVRVTWIADGSEATLRTKLIHEDWDVFHFAGHGEEGTLSCCAPDGTKLPMKSDDLIALLKRRGLSLVVLNSCKGASANVVDALANMARVLSEESVPAVVAMQYAISDAAAVEFTRWFYTTLAAGKPIEEAVDEARDALACNDGREWITPVLYLNRVDGVLLSPRPVPPWPYAALVALLLASAGGGYALWLGSKTTSPPSDAGDARPLRDVLDVMDVVDATDAPDAAVVDDVAAASLGVPMEDAPALAGRWVRPRDRRMLAIEAPPNANALGRYRLWGGNSDAGADYRQVGRILLAYPWGGGSACQYAVSVDTSSQTLLVDTGARITLPGSEDARACDHSLAGRYVRPGGAPTLAATPRPCHYCTGVNQTGYGYLFPDASRRDQCTIYRDCTEAERARGRWWR